MLKPAVVSPSLVTVSSDMVQTQRICDEDEMDCVGDGTVCVAVDQLCDGEQQCPHGEDEDPARCHGQLVSSQHVSVPSHLLALLLTNINYSHSALGAVDINQAFVSFALYCACVSSFLHGCLGFVYFWL